MLQRLSYFLVLLNASPQWSVYSLPDPTEAGSECLRIFFLHIPKTGGTSLGQWLKNSFSDCPYRGNLRYKEWKKLMQRDKIDAKQSLCEIVEFHGNSPGFYEIYGELEEWKYSLKANTCKLTSITVLRESQDLFESAVNFWGHNKAVKDVNSVFMRNLQSQFIFTSFRGPKVRRNRQLKLVTEFDIGDISRKMVSFFEFICKYENLVYCAERIRKHFSGMSMFQHRKLESLNVNSGRKQSYSFSLTKYMTILDGKLMSILNESGILI